MQSTKQQAEAQAGHMNKDIQEAAAMYALLGKGSEKSQKMAQQLRKADILMEMNKD